jgi:hypothetical protein
MGNDEVPADAAQDRRRLFAAELRQLREDAGNPSFRKMAEKSGCISHATLHEAATGSRFPSWETTREFVKACDQPDESWRARWNAAKGDNEPEPAPAEQALVPRHARMPRTLVSAAALVLAVVVAIVVAARPGVDNMVALAGPSPVPPPTGPRVAGDATKFIADVTVPDGSALKLNQSVVKVWEIQNTGKVTWQGRYLQRMDLPAMPTTCHTPDRVAIGDTAPGEKVMISVTVQAPAAPTSCWIGWKMVDVRGEQFFGSSRPVYVLVNAVP